MSVFNARQFLDVLYRRCIISLPSINLSRTQKIFIICLTGGSLLLGGLAQFLKRRRRHPIPPSRRPLRDLKQRFANAKNSNFDAVSQASWARRSEASSRSHISDRVSLISSVPGGPDGDVKLTPQQFGVLGLEALEKALYCWEDALTAFSSSLSNDTLALPSKADAAFTHDVQELLDMGYQIQTQAELLFIDQQSVLFRNDSEETLDSRKPSHIGSRISGKEKADAASSPESFESARDGVADLREFEEFSEFFPHIEKQKLYHNALRHHEDKTIQCRRLHTELVKCGSDVEYLAKLHCLRQAYTKLFTIPTATVWIADIGRQTSITRATVGILTTSFLTPGSEGLLGALRTDDGLLARAKQPQYYGGGAGGKGREVHELLRHPYRLYPPRCVRRSGETAVIDQSYFTEQMDIRQFP
ncbi:mitoguardin isoform X3 [Augochlora pura]